MCYKCKLTNADLDEMQYGDCIDYIDAYIAMHEKSEESEVKDATQEDIDRFFG